MKNILALFLAFSFFAQSFVPVGMVAYYHINKRYIAQQLCENRNNPASNCQGHCYLSKQLKKAEEGERKQSSGIIKEKEEIIADEHTLLPATYFPDFTVYQFIPYSASHIPAEACTTLLKPPAA
ncbi:MAG: hypothetical protein IPH78_12575 [Bacteroidetes bacterium]|nr:hypothetical protein [Bacteroidota bacterium]